MMYRVDLAVEVAKTLTELSDDDRQEVMEITAAALADPNSWPAPGGCDWALRTGPQQWIAFTAGLDGIDVFAVGAIDIVLHAA